MRQTTQLVQACQCSDRRVQIESHLKSIDHCREWISIACEQLQASYPESKRFDAAIALLVQVESILDNLGDDLNYLTNPNDRA